MNYTRAAERLPAFLRGQILHFETEVARALDSFSAGLQAGIRVLDAGAGEARHRGLFPRQRYCAVDMAVGDANWDYTRLDTVADLSSLPFREASFGAAVHIVTLEHLREPARALAELARVLAPGGLLLLVAPQDWEVHQAPHDYFRYTRYGLAYLAGQAGFELERIEAVGGYFRLLGRRLLGGVRFFTGGPRWMVFPLAVLFLGIPGLLISYLDALDRERNFTLGYICIARKRS